MKIKKDPVHREFKRAKGGERRPKVLLDHIISAILFLMLPACGSQQLHYHYIYSHIEVRIMNVTNA